MSTRSGPATPLRAWVRTPSAAYARCLRGNDDAAAPDAELAQRQHEGYVAALRAAGVVVEHIAPAADLPDACFVEDGAVILGAAAVLTRPGAPSRRAEVDSLVPHLGQALALHRLEAPATLDGGDVMRIGSRLLVGRSRRSNDAGIEQLRRVAADLGIEVIAVDVPAGVLHLKSVCSVLDATSVVVDADALPAAALQRLGLAAHAVPEALGANVLAFEDRLLVSAAAPRTVELLRARGHDVMSVDIGELHRGDGALSCLSLRQPPPGRWAV